MSKLITLIMWLGRWTVDMLKLQWGIKRLLMSTDWLTDFRLLTQSSSIADDNEGSKFEMIMHHGIKLVSCADSVLKKNIIHDQGFGEGLSPPPQTSPETSPMATFRTLSSYNE